MTTPSLPAHLSGNEAQGWIEGAPIAQFELGAHHNFSYLILDWDLRQAAVIDPQDDSTPEEALRSHGFDLTRIFLTHSHSDHVGGIGRLISLWPRLRIGAYHSEVAHLRHHKELPLDRLDDGQKVRLSDKSRLEVEILHTPGHTEGSACFLLAADANYLFTGDTVFVRDCGRTDLKGGSNAKMFASLKRIAHLSPGTVILPGHHYSSPVASTLGDELEHSPVFRARTVEELAAI